MKNLRGMILIIFLENLQMAVRIGGFRGMCFLRRAAHPGDADESMSVVPMKISFIYLQPFHYRVAGLFCAQRTV